MYKLNTTISLRTNDELWAKYGKLVGNRSEDLNNYMKETVSLENIDSVDELTKEINNKETEIKNIQLELKALKKRVYELNKQQEANEKNTVLILEKMISIKNIVENYGGITRKEIKYIAGEDIKDYVLINECEKQNIPIITENKQQKDKKGNIINSKPVQRKPYNNDDTFESIMKLLNRRFKRDKAKYNNDKKRFLNDPENKFDKMCNNQEISFEEVKKTFLNNSD